MFSFPKLYVMKKYELKKKEPLKDYKIQYTYTCLDIQIKSKISGS